MFFRGRAPRRLRSPGARPSGAFSVLILALVAALCAGCSGRSVNEREPVHPPRGEVTGRAFRIALQFGLAYAPLWVAKERGLVGARLPETDVEWIQLGNAASIREAMLARRLDDGFMGIPPFLIGSDRGMSWKLFTGLCEAPLALVTRDPGIRELADFTPEDRLAVPQPGSIQHILLCMAAERQLGDPTRFDNQLLTLAHPDAMTALLSGPGLSAHFAPPPYVFEELEAPDAHAVLTGAEAFGGTFTFIVGVASGDVADTAEGRRMLDALTGALAEAIGILAVPDGALIGDLAGLYGIPEGTLLSYLEEPDLHYTLDVRGLSEFARAMHRFGYLRNATSADALTTAGARMP